jgi:hypothetical protein
MKSKRSTTTSERNSPVDMVGGKNQIESSTPTDVFLFLCECVCSTVGAVQANHARIISQGLCLISRSPMIDDRWSSGTRNQGYDERYDHCTCPVRIHSFTVIMHMSIQAPLSQVHKCLFNIILFNRAPVPRIFPVSFLPQSLKFSSQLSSASEVSTCTAL